MKFKVGDKVKVVRRTNVFVDEMEQYIGTVQTIIKIEHYPDGDGYYLDGIKRFIFDNEALELANDDFKIVITVNGDETTAKMYSNREVIKTAVAKCSKSDVFDFKTGAKLAFERLMAEPEEKFVPYLVDDDEENYGIIGEPTNYKDVIGRPLVIGDVVEIFDDKGNSYGEHSIVFSRKTGSEINHTFVMGIESECNDTNGTISSRWRIFKTRSYSEIKDGEKVGFIKYIKEIAKC